MSLIRQNTKSVIFQLILLVGLISLLAGLKPLSLTAISFYQVVLSRHKGWQCGFAKTYDTQTCSQYAHNAISQFGLFKGAFLTRKRFSTCAGLAKKHRLEISHAHQGVSSNE